MAASVQIPHTYIVTAFLNFSYFLNRSIAALLLSAEYNISKILELNIKIKELTPTLKSYDSDST